MKSFLYTILAVLLVLSFVTMGHAMKLTDTIELDGFGKYIHAVEDLTDSNGGDSTRTLALQYNTNYIFEGEVGVTYDNLVRVSYGHEAIEYYEGTDSIDVELYLSKLLDLPVNVGVVGQYKWIENRVMDDGDKFFGVGLVVRLP